MQATGRCVELYSGAAEFLVAYNTCFAHSGAAWGDGLWLQAQYGDVALVEKIATKWNIFDSKSTAANPQIVLSTGSTTSAACPSGRGCPFVGNGLFMGERGANAWCVYWDTSDAAVQQFTCSQWATTFNSLPGNSGNFRADPRFVDRGAPTVLANLKLTSASAGYLDAGGSFCTASAAGSGNTINVTCGPYTTDPRYYFAEPAAFYGLTNNDCKGRGTRPADAINSGCFDIQIAGACGVREVTGMTATSITFGGSSCTWSSGAMVHVPWSGSAPDLGALEYSGSAGPAAPTLLSVEPVL
jgi:hypothetical protein